MSEHQYVVFRAIDRAVTEEDLKFMRTQSSRAQVTPWSFENEYHYGDFRGDAAEMLRRGYDLHLHYANFGVRKLMIRFPDGLPDAAGARPYLGKRSLAFAKDKDGPGGTLVLEPYHEPGDLPDLWDFALVDRLLPLRAEILDGDLRPFYLAHLIMASDGEHDPEESAEAPVPAGLDQLTAAQQALAELYGLSDHLIAAAAEESPPLASRDDPASAHAAWVRALPTATKDQWLTSLLADPSAGVRREMLAAFGKERELPVWPTAVRGRTLAALEATAEGLEKVADRRAAERAARERAKRIAAMAKDPAKVVSQVEELVGQRGHDAYAKAAKLLAELREALAGSDQAGLAEQQASALRERHPTLSMLVSELRKQKFLAK